jgi:hypothetical protein
MSLPIPKKIPELGFYYHYKHDPNGDFNNYAYEILGITRDSETKEFGVLYRPLYESTYMYPASYTVRPLEMFMESVRVDSHIVLRFQKIADSEVIAKLEKIRSEMYP